MVVYAADEMLVEVGEITVPETFYFLVRRPRMRLALRLRVASGVLEVDSVTIARGDAGSVTASTLRDVNLRELVISAGARAALHVDGGTIQPAGFKVSLGRGTRSQLGALHMPRRGKRVTDEKLEEVARYYREALGSGQPPTQYVQRKMQIAYSTAGRYVMETRRRGFLGPTRPGQPGEKGDTDG
ncbi:MAG: hypothetical protein ACYDCH_03930 [Gaiellaceae bacterium]